MLGPSKRLLCGCEERPTFVLVCSAHDETQLDDERRSEVLAAAVPLLDRMELQRLVHKLTRCPYCDGFHTTDCPFVKR